MSDLDTILAELSFKATLAPRGPPRKYAPSTAILDKGRTYDRKQREEKFSNIAVLDFETDPFDNVNKSKIEPFLAVLYSDDWEPIVLWDTDSKSLIEKLWSVLINLTKAYTIYAHNGGKFDFMLFVHKLRGRVSFKGRGIMSATIEGKHATHTLRDSFHLIPEKLATLKKDEIDYKRMSKALREKHRAEIIRYCVHDCEYLLAWVKDFVAKYGMKMTIGQAALTELKKEYTVERLSEGSDEHLRKYYMGGRVECLTGRTWRKERFSLYDVNSMYPYVMAKFAHPVGAAFRERRGRPSSSTIFIRLRCSNRRSLVSRDIGRGETTTAVRHGEFYTTIWEYEVARKYGMITDIEILSCIDFFQVSDFSRTILPLYEAKIEASKRKTLARKDTLEHDIASKDYTFSKLFQNNIYGKFAQNPRFYTDHFITDWGERPPEKWFENIEYSMDLEERQRQRRRANRPVFECAEYAIWQKPAPSRRYNNVATAASITGAARAVLMEAIYKAEEPIYCDTDSIICRGLDAPIDPTILGAWKHEKDYDEVIINGKKLYSAIVAGETGKPVVKCKGVQAFDPIKAPDGLTWKDMETLYEGGEVTKTGAAPTFVKTGHQYYIERKVRATADMPVSMEL